MTGGIVVLPSPVAVAVAPIPCLLVPGSRIAGVLEVFAASTTSGWAVGRLSLLLLLLLPVMVLLLVVVGLPAQTLRRYGISWVIVALADTHGGVGE